MVPANLDIYNLGPRGLPSCHLPGTLRIPQPTPFTPTHHHSPSINIPTGTSPMPGLPCLGPRPLPGNHLVRPAHAAHYACNPPWTCLLGPCHAPPGPNNLLPTSSVFSGWFFFTPPCAFPTHCSASLPHAIAHPTPPLPPSCLTHPMPLACPACPTFHIWVPVPACRTTLDCAGPTCHRTADLTLTRRCHDRLVNNGVDARAQHAHRQQRS